jgi:hypothetical protein
MCLNLRRQGGQSGEGAFPVSLAKKSERVPVFGEHALIPRQHRTKIVRQMHRQIFRQMKQKAE